MGLLDRVISEESFPALLNGGVKPFDDKMGVLEGAPRFLSWICGTWNVSRAALLSIDKRTDSFIPSEMTGFDVTTKRRLMIEASTVRSWLGDRIFVQLNDSSLYSPYFSTRETGRSSSLIGIACWKDSLCFALVVILLEEDDKRILTEDSLPVLQDNEAMGRLFKSLFPAESTERESLKKLDGETLKKRILTEGENRILLKIALPSLIEMTVNADPLKDSHDCRGELLALFSSFFNERVKLFLDEEDNLFILQPSDLFPGPGLMENQLRLGLEQLIGGVMSEPIAMKLLETPTDKKELERFLAE